MATSPPPPSPHHGHPSPHGTPSPHGVPAPYDTRREQPPAPADTPGTSAEASSGDPTAPKPPGDPTAPIPHTAPEPVPAPAPRHPHWWQRRTVHIAALSSLLALSGLVILALVREQTGTQGFLVGLGLAVLPVPLLIAVFRWLDRVAPAPWRNMIFAFAWGACAAALVAIVANSFATHWIATATADPSSADTLGATVIAPIVEESSKAAAVLLIFLFRRRDLTGLVDGVVVAGVTATGFAFTENVLYLGTAFGDDQHGSHHGAISLTVATFFVRVVMSPFAHPLFTMLSGIGFGLAAASGERQRVRRVLLPLCGLLLAIGMHATWNASSSFGDYGFLLVYAAFMVPAFGLLTWLVIWNRQRELHTVRGELPLYAMAGWLPPYEASVLGSLRARRVAREYATSMLGGKPAARTVAEYEAFATSLAFLRHRGRRGRAGADFMAQEERLLRELWSRRGIARAALAHALRTLPPTPWQGPVPAPWAPGLMPGPGFFPGPGPFPAGPFPGSGPLPAPGVGPAPYGYGYPGAYGHPGAYGSPGTHRAPGMYAAPGTYAAPGAYGTPGPYGTPMAPGAYGAPVPPGAYGTGNPYAPPHPTGPYGVTRTPETPGTPGTPETTGAPGAIRPPGSPETIEPPVPPAPSEPGPPPEATAQGARIPRPSPSTPPTAASPEPGPGAHRTS